MRLMFCLFVALESLAPCALAQQRPEQAQIEYLIESVGALHDATFVRNGSEYDSRQAAEHLRLKLHNAGNRVRTAEDFIVYCATGSSLSGEKYRIRFADGRIVETAEFLRSRLAGFAALQRHPG